MGAEKWMKIPNLCARFNIKRWRVDRLSAEGKLPVKCIAGVPVIPYEVDAEAFETLISTAQAPKPSSLKTEIRQKTNGRGKEKLPWQ